MSSRIHGEEKPGLCITPELMTLSKCKVRVEIKRAGYRRRPGLAVSAGRRQRQVYVRLVLRSCWISRQKCFGHSGTFARGQPALTPLSSVCCVWPATLGGMGYSWHWTAQAGAGSLWTGNVLSMFPLLETRVEFGIIKGNRTEIAKGKLNCKWVFR